MTSPLELQNLFKAGLLAVEGILPRQGSDCHVIEEELRFEELNQIVSDAMLHTKAATVPLTTKQWASESRKATARIKPVINHTEPVKSHAVDLKPVIEDFDEDENIIGAEPGENGHVLLRIDDGRSTSWTCPKQPTLEVISLGFPRHCHICGMQSPLESLLGTTDGEEDSF